MTSSIVRSDDTVNRFLHDDRGTKQFGTRAAVQLQAATLGPGTFENRSPSAPLVLVAEEVSPTSCLGVSALQGLHQRVVAASSCLDASDERIGRHFAARGKRTRTAAKAQAHVGPLNSPT